jgi:amylosucrase
MAETEWIQTHAPKALARIVPRLQHDMEKEGYWDPDQWPIFAERLGRQWQRIFTLLHHLYGWQYDFFFHLEQILRVTAQSWFERPDDLKALDADRERAPYWFQNQSMVGGVLYVDLFSARLSQLYEHLAYFKKLGITYLHLMPLFAVPHGDNDGGYAVSDYRAVNPDIGTMDELSQLAQMLRAEGISLVLDFVFNHTSDEHQWALKAQAGDPDFQAYYYLFEDRRLPDQYQRYLRDIFPTVRRGSFTWHQGMEKWVWTTFNSYQWDLNYSNPDVFRAMLQEMLFLANQGVSVLRLDAVAFIWKRMGTDCENQPEAHMIIQAFNALARIAAPDLLFKSEAIVHPDEVIRYVGTDECHLSYNPTLMALLWEALATRDVKLLDYAMRHRHRLPEGCAWVNYLRCHDDIGWTFDDGDARAVGIDPVGHRRFLNAFYTGVHEGSFARGISFQYNPDTGDLRISGTLASLAGLEQAVEQEDPLLIEMAVRRVNLLRSIMLSVGGVPLIYLGDEWGALNDYTYLSDPAKAGDSRWVHRSKRKWETRDDLTDGDTLEWRFYHELVRLIGLRKNLPALYNGGMEVVETGNSKLFAFVRQNHMQRLLIVNNFAETPQQVHPRYLKACGFDNGGTDLTSGQRLMSGSSLELDGYRYAWLERSLSPGAAATF